ncbi:unnamed protein product [Lactuca virosa]|uniref:Smr domain-containing protein n=1 Tax=Lactuca virosa TaxID=75947 RepID=A0AAU9NDG5_9ASTR|nr:unnamed protein product [Lactuca virosa]
MDRLCMISSILELRKGFGTTGKTKTLNPDAAEFVPFSLRSPSGNTRSVDTSNFGNFSASTPGKSILKRSESSVSNNSDDEAHQFWRHQLPDDITPDFHVVGEEESNGNGSNSISISIPFSTLSIVDVNGSSRFPEQHESSPHQMNGGRFGNFQQMHGDQLLGGIIDEPLPPYNGDNGQGYLDDMLNEGTEVNSLGFLASQFPGFAAESLAEVYYANGCDLNLTIEMLTQLELQVDNGLNQNPNSKGLSAPNLSALDFPAVSPTDNHHIPPFSAVRKMSSQDSSIWKYDRNPSPNSTIGSSRSSYSSGYGPRSAPVWLETGDAVANMYSEMRGEARDHARLRNAYFEQARQAYHIGQKALAKELSVKGQLHNIQMKAAHGKAQESIYYQRNPVSPEMQGNGRGGGQERIIDLHGLHVSEAIHVLKRDLMTWRNIARSADQRVQVYICVGTGHHTKGTRTPARLPVAVQRYLLEEEGLHYSEPQPGLLRVVLY